MSSASTCWLWKTRVSFCDLLFTGSAQILQIATDRKHLGLEIGVISILHT